MPKKNNTWVVGSGDSYNSIAQKVYGKDKERMFAQIVRLNGGTKMLQPGMVLKLPQLQDNKDIFISNEWAAGMGMATAPDLQQFYADNPFGASATAAMNNGAWTPQGLLPGSVPVPPKPGFKPFVDSNKNSPFKTPYGLGGGAALPKTGFQTPYGMQKNGTYETAMSSNNGSPFQTPYGVGGGAALPARPVPAGTNSPLGPVFGPIANDLFGPLINRMQNPVGLPAYGQNNYSQGYLGGAGIYPGSVPQSPPMTNTGNGIPMGQKNYSSGYMAGSVIAPGSAVTQTMPNVGGAVGQAAGAVNNALTGQAPAGAVKTDAKAAKTGVDVGVVTARDVAMQRVAQVSDKVLMIASGTLNETITPNDAQMLVSFGLVQPGTEDYKELMDRVAGLIPPGPYDPNKTTNGVGNITNDTTTGKWDPFNMGGTYMPRQARPNEPLSQWEIDKRKIGLGAGAAAANPGNASALQNVIGQGMNNMGPSLGLAQWRANL